MLSRIYIYISLKKTNLDSTGIFKVILQLSKTDHVTFYHTVSFKRNNLESEFGFLKTAFKS